ncbi:MAG: fibronectin type III domain-containing protein [bacterium]
MALFVVILLAGFPAPPAVVRVFDTPDDEGHSITVTWELSVDDATITSYDLVRVAEDGVEDVVANLMPGTSRYVDGELPDGQPFRYRVIARADTLLASSELSEPAASRGQWFHSRRVNVLVALLLFSALTLYFIGTARRGKKLFIRRIAGLDAVEEAVGRATEMGRPILYVPGLAAISQISTIAALNILSEIAKKTATYGTDLLVPNRDPIVYTVASEMVREAYAEVGRPDIFRKDSVFFVSEDQFAFAAAVNGIMVREKPATICLIGMFWAESLILAETGATTGAIQIAGTDQISQLPFFVTACDYTLIGEELYAASAYLSRDPLLLGSLKGQDWGKVAVLLILGVCSGLLLLGGIKGFEFLRAIYEFFSVA